MLRAPSPSGILREKPLREQPVLHDVPNLFPVGLNQVRPGEEKFRELVVVAIKVCRRNLEHLRQLLSDFNWRLVNSTLVSADACAGDSFVQADGHAEFVLGNAGMSPCLPQATPKYSNRLLFSHSANIVDSSLCFPTKFVESKTSYERPKSLDKSPFHGSFVARGVMNHHGDCPSRTREGTRSTYPAISCRSSRDEPQ